MWPRSRANKHMPNHCMAFTMPLWGKISLEYAGLEAALPVGSNINLVPVIFMLNNNLVLINTSLSLHICSQCALPTNR